MPAPVRDGRLEGAALQIGQLTHVCRDAEIKLAGFAIEMPRAAARVEGAFRSVAQRHVHALVAQIGADAAHVAEQAGRGAVLRVRRLRRRRYVGAVARRGCGGTCRILRPSGAGREQDRGAQPDAPPAMPPGCRGIGSPIRHPAHPPLHLAGIDRAPQRGSAISAFRNGQHGMPHGRRIVERLCGL